MLKPFNLKYSFPATLELPLPFDNTLQNTSLRTYHFLDFYFLFLQCPIINCDSVSICMIELHNLNLLALSGHHSSSADGVLLRIEVGVFAILQMEMNELKEDGFV